MAEIRDGKYAPLKVKLLWTALFFLCFMIGRNIPIPLLHDVARGSDEADADLLNAANIATGGSFFYPSLFSLGLGPWMGAAILWRFLFIAKFARDHKIPEETVNRARYVLVVALAIIQATGLIGRYDIDGLSWGPFTEVGNAEVVVVVFLTAGALIVAWLAKRNEDLGLGGITMFILYQLIITATRNMEVLHDATRTGDDRRVLVLVILACLCVAALTVVGGGAELRLHVNKVAIDNGYSGMSYLPIKLNPAGASPIMYALTLLVLPQWIAHGIGALVPATSDGVDRFLGVWGLTGDLGFSIYLLLLFGLTIFFGLFSVSPQDIAERMEKAGEYFDHVAPGRATRQYVRRRVVFLSAVTGVLVVILTGLPLYYIRTYPHLQWLLMAPGTVMIVLGLLWLLQEEVADTVIGTKYALTLRAAA